MTRQNKIEFLSILAGRAEDEAYEAEFVEENHRKSDQLRAIAVWLKEQRILTNE